MKSFDQKYHDIIELMKISLVDDGLNMISFTDTDGWSFKMSIPRPKWKKFKSKVIGDT